MSAEMDRSRWENGLGLRGRNAREFRNQFAAVLFDGAGEPAAIAGAFLTYGAFEISINIARAHRDKGLAPVVVKAVAGEILQRSETRHYGCAEHDIHSRRAALASGFLPVYSDAAVG